MIPCIPPRYRAGLTLVEVIIAIGILSAALVVLVGNVASLNLNHRSQQEYQRTADICKLVAEHIQGINWSMIGSSSDPLTWARVGPVSPTSPTPEDINEAVKKNGAAADIPPLTETAEDPEHNMLSPEVGLLTDPSGITDLRIWVEYRRMSMIDGVATMSEWNEALDWEANDEALIDVQDRLVFNPATFTDAVLVRVVARWEAANGGERHYEISFARRR